ncbi:hypothetical protein JX265_013331 [Neoarthrinium moseri]|uniref:Antifungal protein n=1 Tax=Neoarthrinium moseri TaxID=1658444 RepID=A0A9P9W9A7_9PEZI|nr:uncharacterized protein JN550_005217 [Neoarthrinium moseri]KAI1843449.1 hypothetical protein JX266_010446 [Neoarthrinium moseri]KAI1850851.1 hypothetical protein JX265_013331 [Neoarthrinium moseri]KAI1870289.1 hypothetical protein JN550_005217 [Neoarthrinium moseri]
MLFKTTTILSAAAALFASQAMAAAVPEGQDLSPRDALIATNPVAACNCPNNCSHKAGSGCKYKAGTSTDGSTVSGKCADQGGQLVCVPK